MGTTGRSYVIVNSTTRKAYKSQPGRQEWITVIECICADGTSIAPLLIYKGESLSGNWFSAKELPPLGWCFSHSSKGWTSMKHGEEWLRRCFEPATRGKANRQMRLLICDGHDSHITAQFVRHCIDNKIILLLLPPHSSHLLQPLDVGVFKSLKSNMTKELDGIFHTGIHRLHKAEWLKCYIKARPQALTEANIHGGWRGAGLFPRNKIRILRQLPDSKDIDFESDLSSSPSPITPSTSISEPPLFPTSSPPEPAELHEKNTHLRRVIANSDLEPHVQKSLSRALGFGEQLQAHNTILTKENKSLRDIVAARKERESGKRVVLKGKFIVSTEEVYQALFEAQKKADAKAKTGSKKKKDTCDTTPIEEGQTEESEMLELDCIVVR